LGYYNLDEWQKLREEKVKKLGKLYSIFKRSSESADKEASTAGVNVEKVVIIRE
jgi:hypothetical protein